MPGFHTGCEFRTIFRKMGGITAVAFPVAAGELLAVRNITDPVFINLAMKSKTKGKKHFLRYWRRNLGGKLKREREKNRGKIVKKRRT